MKEQDKKFLIKALEIYQGWPLQEEQIYKYHDKLKDKNFNMDEMVLCRLWSESFNDIVYKNEFDQLVKHDIKYIKALLNESI